MAFIKHGDGKIVSVVDVNDLTEEEKKKVKDASQKEEELKSKKTN